MPTYIGGCVNPYLYGTGDTLNGIQGFVPDYGIPEVPIPLDNTFLIELGDVYVPQLPPDLRNMTDAWKITFLNPGSPTAKKQFVVSNGFGNDTIPQGYDFFNTITEGSPSFKTNGVFNIAVAGQNSAGIKQFFAAPKYMLLSMRGVFTVESVTFPWTNSNNPRPNQNFNGIQRGSKVSFFTEDNFFLYTFDMPQDIRTSLNTLPE